MCAMSFNSAFSVSRFFVFMYILGRTGRVQLHNACAHGHWRACEYAAWARTEVNTVVFIWRPVVPRLQMVYVTSQGTLIKSSCKAPTTAPPPPHLFLLLLTALWATVRLWFWLLFAFQGAPGTQAYTWQPGPQVCSTKLPCWIDDLTFICELQLIPTNLQILLKEEYIFTPCLGSNACYCRR